MQLLVEQSPLILGIEPEPWKKGSTWIAISNAGFKRSDPLAMKRPLIVLYSKACGTVPTMSTASRNPWGYVTSCWKNMSNGKESMTMSAPIEVKVLGY